MSRPATTRLKVNPPLGTLPVLQYQPPAALAIDPVYQRSMENSSSQALVRRIAQHWNWDLCQPLVVSRRDGGEMFVIDGQHRLAAAQLRNDISVLPCVVTQFACVADEAASFVHLNQQRRPLTAVDLFKAALASGDQESVAIATAMEAAGLSVAPHSNYISWKPGMVANISGLQRAWRQHGPQASAAAMIVMRQAFEGQTLRYAGTVYPGIVAVVAAEFEGLTLEERAAWLDDEYALLLIEMIGATEQAEWRKKIALWSVANPNDARSKASAAVFAAAWAEYLGGDE